MKRRRATSRSRTSWRHAAAPAPGHRGRCQALLIGRPPTAQETDELWALLSPEVYLLLVDEAGWTPAAYQDWVAATLERRPVARLNPRRFEMTNDLDRPAEARIMNIVHQALRRRSRACDDHARDDPSAGGTPAEAIAGHLAWMMDFLRAHHESEDAGLYPAVQHAPRRAAVLGRMDRDHQQIADHIDAQLRCTSGPLPRHQRRPRRPRDLLRRSRPTDIIPPRLRRGGRADADRVQALTAAEWQATSRSTTWRPRTGRQLALEGRWLIDGAGPDDG